MKQSSIEWLIDQLEKHYVKTDLKNTVAYQQAKAMHKEEMIDFAYNCRNLMAGDEFAITHWYDKTFNTKEK